jgi:hypothetical protein
VPDSSDTTFDTSIPVLQEVLVRGKPEFARAPRETGAAQTQPQAAEPADGVTVHAVTPAQVQAFELPEPPAPAELAAAQEPAPFEPASAFHFSRAQGEAAAAVTELDADVLADRLRGRFASYLTGEGRTAIEARCRDALQDHTTWLVNQITREVALALETEITGWVREAVEDELARRSKEH